VDATNELKDAQARGAASDTIEVLQQKEAKSLLHSDTAMAHEREARNAMQASEEGARRQLALVHSLKQKGEHLRGLITQVRAAKVTAQQQNLQAEALRVKTALDTQDEADEDQRVAVRAALKYAGMEEASPIET